MENKPVEKRIRVSAAGLVRIELAGKLLVEVNKNRGNVLTPIGGALEFHEEAREFLISLGAEFQKGPDIRLTLPQAALPEFEVWFKKRVERELSPERELREELLEEHSLSIPPGLLATCEAQYLWLAQTTQETSRVGQKGVLTSYFFEIFQITPSPKLTAALLAALPGAKRLRLITLAEVAKKRTDDGMPIAESVPFLLRAPSTAG